MAEIGGRVPVCIICGLWLLNDTKTCIECDDLEENEAAWYERSQREFWKELDSA